MRVQVRRRSSTLPNPHLTLVSPPVNSHAAGMDNLLAPLLAIEDPLERARLAAKMQPELNRLSAQVRQVRVEALKEARRTMTVRQVAEALGVSAAKIQSATGRLTDRRIGPRTPPVYVPVDF